MKYTKPSELLDAMDSHSIVNARILDECDFETRMIPRFTEAEVKSMIAERGLGGTLRPLGDPAGERLLNGWTTAEALARAFLGDDPGAKYQGRGSIFRACRTALVEAGH